MTVLVVIAIIIVGLLVLMHYILKSTSTFVSTLRARVSSKNEIEQRIDIYHEGMCYNVKIPLMEGVEVEDDLIIMKVE